MGDEDGSASRTELAYAEERLLACERLGEELRRSIDMGDKEPLVIHYRERYARLEREIATWRWYRRSVRARLKTSAQE